MVEDLGPRPATCSAGSAPTLPPRPPLALAGLDHGEGAEHADREQPGEDEQPAEQRQPRPPGVLTVTRLGVRDGGTVPLPAWPEPDPPVLPEDGAGTAVGGAVTGVWFSVGADVGGAAAPGWFDGGVGSNRFVQPRPFSQISGQAWASRFVTTYAPAGVAGAGREPGRDPCRDAEGPGHHRERRRELHAEAPGACRGSPPSRSRRRSS